MTAVESPQRLIAPNDIHNRTLVDRVHPSGWTNPEPASRYNLVVLGGGTAGLVSAIGAASLGARVALVERYLLGGDCLNFGCVPSKALLATARQAAAQRASDALGIAAGDPRVDFPAVMARVRRLRAALAGHDSLDRLRQLGVDVFLGQATFVGHDAVAVGGRRLRFARAIVATGTRAAVPALPGLMEVGVLTNETVFSLTEQPRRLIVIGGGPVGCELAQAFARFGSAVTLISRGHRLLSREDPDASALVEGVLRRDGVTVALDATIVRAAQQGDPPGREVAYDADGQRRSAVGDAILVAAGRVPNLEGLDLPAAGIEADAYGVMVDDHLRTSNRRVYAAGDVCTRERFTHVADATARIAVRNALFFGRRKVSGLTVPRVTYTDPEVAHVGRGTATDVGPGGALTLTVPMAQIDRAVLDGETDGFARVCVERRSGKILGATMVARHAGESLTALTLAMASGRGLGTLSETIHPYPTQAEAWKKLGDAWQRTRLTPRVRTWLGRFLRWQCRLRWR